MLEGSIFKGLFTLAMPIMVMNVLQSLFNIIDMTILKTFGTSGNAVGAVGVCSSLITLITVLVTGISTGANVTIARNIGRNDPEGVKRAVGTSVLFSAIGGLLLAIIGVSGAGMFLNWTNCPDTLYPQATLYFRLYFAGVPILMVYNFCAAILRSSGDSKRPMLFLTAGGAVKVGLTYLLVAQFDMGVEGVAVATIISWSVSAILGLGALVRNEGNVKLCKEYFRLYKEELRHILFIGVPAGLQKALYSVANVIITATVNSFGPEATTGVSIANQYDGVLYQICTATAFAIVPYVSQNIGAGNVKRAMQSVWKGILITVGLGAFFGALSATFTNQLSAIMSDDPVVIDYSRQKMIIISSTYFICGINEIFGSALRAMGKPMAATVATMVYMCVFRFFWVYIVFPMLPQNCTYLYLVWPIGWILSIATLLPMFFSRVKKLNAMHAPTG